MHIDAIITNTPIGQEYQWDRLSDVSLDLLQQNRESMMRVLGNSSAFPKADIVACRKKVDDIDAFMSEYGPLLVQFA